MQCSSFLMVFLVSSTMLWAQPGYQPTPGNVEARTKFQDDKYGLFIHWGVYSVLADGEWIMRHRPITVKDYEKLPAFFNPQAFDAAEWVSMAKAAGMKYITVTTKHHDGFAMWDSKVSDYNIVKKTPYGKDIIKMLADECKKQGMVLNFYYSHLDWYHTDYFPRGETSLNPGGKDWSKRPDAGKWENYLNYMNAQLTELLTNYGPIGCIWFDGWWDKKDADWKLDEQYALIHRLQPNCMIGNNHHRAPKPGEDFQMFEKDLPGHNTTGFSDEGPVVGALPLEMCETMNGSWGYRITDNKYKTVDYLIDLMASAAGYNSNFLLNVGPQPDGKIQPEFADTLKKMSLWLNKYGESIYGTRGGPVKPSKVLVSTQKGNIIYLHVLKPEEGPFVLPEFKGKKVASATLLTDGKALAYRLTDFGLVFEVPQTSQDRYNTVIKLVLK